MASAAPNRSPILHCVDHALPYQVIFEEHRARRPWDLLFATLEAFPEFSPEDVKDTRWNGLLKQRDDAISKLNERRRNLAELEAQLGELLRRGVLIERDGKVIAPEEES